MSAAIFAMVDDAALLAGWRAGDRAMGEQLFERHFATLYRFFGNKVDAADVGDLVQKTFLACVEAADTFRGLSSVRTFFFAVARHQLYHHYRARRRAPDLDVGVTSVADLTPSPSSLVARAEEQRLLGEAFTRIPLELQIALELRFLEGLRGPELAQVLDIPEGTVRSRLRRGIEALRAQVEALPGALTERRAALVSVETWSRDAPPSS
ncbi:MAG: sigma-70 family RNA polymerase sigma factor [Sandaracinaceae bacterium]|nr:sigma-70 family RNA polymerase sigma factor [Sandaracinaceae bacterium]